MKFLLTILLFISTISLAQTSRLTVDKKMTNIRTRTINVYLRIGDSNEAGGSATEDGTFPLKYHTTLSKALIYFKPDRTSNNNGQWLNYSDTSPYINRFSGYQPVQATSMPYGVGPDISFTYSFDSAATRTPIGIIKCALGGTKLTSEWLSGASMYNFFLPYSYTVGISDLSTISRFNTINVKAVIVRLGTNDATIAAYNDVNFKAAIQSFTTAIRSVTGLPTLPIYWVQVNSNLPSSIGGLYNSTNVNLARAAITACETIGNPALISNFTVINYDSYPLLADGVHYTQDACLAQGFVEYNLLKNL